ncbi:MAG: galactokinase [Clostridia bacterium]|nr:galactokinase [Clostridia bacterium]MBQ2940947.1 galactokinase [Clostridia bacterium]
MEITEMKQLFLETFGDNGGELRVFASPGRVNLIGEHIDYCGGCVLPAALTMQTTLVARKREDDIIRLKATDLDILVETKISEMEELKGKLKWGDYQLGVALELIAAGYGVGGCDLLYDDTVPHGGGLSSSAAIEVSTALCLATFANEKAGIEKEIDMIEMALISQKAEHNFIGVKCGIMDQFASAMGKADHAVYLNCATLEYEHLPLKLEGSKIVLTNTNVKHSLGSSKYNERRGECEEGLNALKAALPNIEQLSDVTKEQFEEHKMLIENEVTRKRIKHVVYECDRVRQSAAAMKANDIAAFGAFMNGSHDSLQYDYEVTCPELDFVVAEGRKIDGVLGIRMTGAGFGGCTVAIIKDDAIDTYIETVGKAYLDKFGHEASFYVTEIGNGGREIC